MNIKNVVKNSFPAFTHRNFTLFWSGQVVSLIGSWMQNAALSWLVYSITNDRLLLSLMTVVQFTPLFFLSLPFGIIVEKYPKRKIIIFTQTMLLIAAFMLFLLIATDNIKYPYILIIVSIIGTVQALDNPARQSFVVEMVEGREHLLNAIALNSAAFNGARLIGPAFAGKVMSIFGAKWCFFFNAISFLAVLIGLLMMRMEDKPARKNVENPFREIIEGIKYIGKTPKLLYTFMVVAIIPTFCINFNILIPIYTRDILHLKEDAFGMLLSSLGLGALIGAVSVAAKGKRERALNYQLIGSSGLAIFLILLSFSKTYYLSLILLTFSGFFMIMFNTTSNSIMQFNSPDEMRGRIMSAYSLVFGGLIPVGSFYAGMLSKYFGPEITFRVSGIMGFFGFYLLFRKRKELC